VGKRYQFAEAWYVYRDLIGNLLTNDVMAASWGQLVATGDR
jgi:hypothetical protein